MDQNANIIFVWVYLVIDVIRFLPIHYVVFRLPNLGSLKNTK